MSHAAVHINAGMQRKYAYLTNVVNYTCIFSGGAGFMGGGRRFSEHAYTRTHIFRTLITAACVLVVYWFSYSLAQVLDIVIKSLC